MNGPAAPVSYRILFRLGRGVRLRVGALGRHHFPAGTYAYTGSARRGLDARVRRHLRRDKPLRWHIDYLLTRPEAEVLQVERSPLPECELNRSAGGRVLVPGFGSSDCRAGCGSHLRYLGADAG